MKYIKSISFGLSIFLILNLIITIISYFNLLKDTTIFKIIVLLITFISIGIYLGLIVKKKSLVNGSIISLVLIIISIILTLIIPNINLSIKSLIYYLFIFITINIGTFIGTNKKKV